MAEHDWPSERGPKSFTAHVQWVGERCSICGVKRHPVNLDIAARQLSIAAGPCPGPGADGVPWPVKRDDDESEEEK